MATSKQDNVLVVIQLSGGNDALNTIVPYADPRYLENRPVVRIDPEKVLPINDAIGFNPALQPIKALWDQGNVAIVQGIGYPNPIRSHFRSMDIWHTCEPDKVGTEGWLGRAIRDLDPRHDNVLTGVNFGRGLPRALAVPGVPVASVGNLETYGVLTGIKGEDQRTEALELFANMYAPKLGRPLVKEYISQTGVDALSGADILSTAPQKYASTVNYAGDAVAQYLRNIAQVYLAGLGTRVLYTTAPQNSFDTHASELGKHTQLWQDVSNGVSAFFQDLKEHNAGANVVVLLFTEFGRRVHDNGSGTDHGSGGIAFVIGDAVNGGLYGEYPSLAPEKLLEGDLHYNNDFRGTYATLLEKWLGLDSKPIVGGTFEQLAFLS
jgi:uncharacterized protein (DUF1501 family)